MKYFHKTNIVLSYFYILIGTSVTSISITKIENYDFGKHMLQKQGTTKLPYSHFGKGFYGLELDLMANWKLNLAFKEAYILFSSRSFTVFCGGKRNNNGQLQSTSIKLSDDE